MGKSLATSNNNKKTKILIKKVFPQLAPIDFSNIIGKTLVTYLRVNSNIITKETARIISCFLNNKILKPDKIPNKALKTCKLLIALWFSNVAKVYFVINYYPRLGKAITTIVLHKKSKADYLLPKSYCLIALKNTLSKILKRVIIKYIADIAKKICFITAKPNRGKKEPLNTISTYFIY